MERKSRASLRRQFEHAKDIEKCQERAGTTFQGIAGLPAIVGDAWLSQVHLNWVEEALRIRTGAREKRRSESVAAGDSTFLEKIQSALGGRALGRKIVSSAASHELRQSQVACKDHFGPENMPVSLDIGLFWQVYDENSIGSFGSI
ncbi:MAG: hypothetical protein ACP5IL_16000 [Syntrophobacteraceae bacterium]